MKLIYAVLFILILTTISYAWDAPIEWIPPTTFADNTPLNPAIDIKGYRICYSKVSPGDCSTFIDVGNVTTYTMTGIITRKLFYTVRTIDQDGDVSIDSNEIWRKVKINAATLTNKTCTATITCSK